MDHPHGCEKGPCASYGNTGAGAGARGESARITQPAAEHASQQLWSVPSHPGKDVAPSPRPWKVGQRRLQQADGPFLTSPGTPSSSRVPQDTGAVH